MSSPPPIQSPPDPTKSQSESTEISAALASPVAQTATAVHDGIRSTLSTTFIALSHREFLHLWGGSFLSNIGTFVQIVALQSVLWEMTHDERWLGAFQLFQWIPTILFLPVGGVIADRIDRRNLMIMGNVGETILAIVLAVLYILHLLQPIHILLVAAASGAMAAVVVPASQALFPQLVGQKDLSNAIALNTMQWNVSRAVGPMLGAIALVKLGATSSFIINAISFLAVIWALSSIRKHPLPERSTTESMFGSVLGGVRYVQSRKDIVICEIMFFGAAFCGAPMFSMLPAYVDRVYHPATQVENTAMFGTLLTCFGFGAAVGAAYLASMGRKIAHPWASFPLMAFYALTTIGLALHPSFLLAQGLTFLAGFFHISACNRLFSAVIGSSRPVFRGRVASIHFMCFSTGMPTGGALAGFLSNQFGIDRVIAIYSVVMLLILGGLIWYRTANHVRFKQDGHLEEEAANQPEGQAAAH